MAILIPKNKTFTTASGCVERAEVIRLKPFGFTNVRNTFKLAVAVRLEDGALAHFQTPAVAEVISTATGAAVKTLAFAGKSADWFKSAGADDLEPLVKVGDRLTVCGRIKKVKIDEVAKTCDVLLTNIDRKAA